jgi:RHS repeat-associated protein
VWRERRAGAATAGTTWSPTAAFAATSSVPTTQSFTGQRADSTAGLFYYGARYYDNLGSTFTSADTVADALNRYGYVGYNPSSRTDPSGHRACVDEECGKGGGQPDPGPGGLCGMEGCGTPGEPSHECFDLHTCQYTPPPCYVTHTCSNDPGLVKSDDIGRCTSATSHPKWCEKYYDYDSGMAKQKWFWEFGWDVWRYADYLIFQFSVGFFGVVGGIATWYFIPGSNLWFDGKYFKSGGLFGGPNISPPLSALAGFGILMTKGDRRANSEEVARFLGGPSFSGGGGIILGSGRSENDTGVALEYHLMSAAGATSGISYGSEWHGNWWCMYFSPIACLLPFA